MTRPIPAEQKIKNLLHEIGELRKEIISAIKRKLITCEECGKRSRISNWIFIQAHYYVYPYSCSGGDYWLPSDDDVCFIECPKCGKRNYIYVHPQKVDILEAIKRGGGKRFFKRSEKFYKE